MISVPFMGFRVVKRLIVAAVVLLASINCGTGILPVSSGASSENRRELSEPAGADVNGADEKERPLLEAARRRIEQCRKADFTMRLIDENGQPVAGQGRVRLIGHAFTIGARLRPLIEQSRANPVAARGLLLMEDLVNAVSASGPDDPAAAWARDREKKVVPEGRPLHLLSGTKTESPKLEQIDEALARRAAGDGPFWIDDLLPAGMDGPRHAELTLAVVTLAFSRPGVSGVCWRTPLDRPERGEAGLLDHEGRKKPLYDALQTLLGQTWCTDWNGRIEGGKLAYRGFLGTYKVDVDGYVGDTFTASSSAEARQATVVLVKHNGE